MIACTLSPLADVYTCLYSCLEIETGTLPSQRPDKECQRCFAKTNEVDPCDRDDLFWTNCYSTPYNSFSPVLSLLSVSLSDSLSPSTSSSVCVLLCVSYSRFLLKQSQKWIQIPPNAHTPQPHRCSTTDTHCHSSTLWNSLRPLPVRVSCFPHACSRLFPVGLFVCGPALEGRPSVRCFLFSPDWKCRAAGISVHLNQQQNTLTFPLPTTVENSAHLVVVTVQIHCTLKLHSARF